MLLWSLFPPTLINKCKAFVWMAALLRGMSFRLQSSVYTVKNVLSIIATLLFLVNVCKPQKAYANLPFSFISPVCFLILCIRVSSFLTSHPILELLWPCSCCSISSTEFWFVFSATWYQFRKEKKRVPADLELSINWISHYSNSQSSQLSYRNLWGLE